jgi:subtilisin family serine protease
MKRIFSSLVLMVCILQVFGQSNYYYYRGEKVYLNHNTQTVFLLTTLSNQNEVVKIFDRNDFSFTKFLKDNGASGLIQRDMRMSNFMWSEIKFAQPLGQDEYSKVLEKLNQNPQVIMASPFFANDKSPKIGLSHYLNVKLKSESDISVLEQLSIQYKFVIVGQNKFMPLWYTLACDKNTGMNALQLANALFETGKVQASEPDLMTDDGGSCVNDPFFTNQWGHANTGQNGGTVGMDIRACDAWEITKGSSGIITAVLDQGFEMNHPDLQTNVSGTGFDTESGTSPGLVLDNHGTACAGIISARDDNSIGTAGVAPRARIMNVSNSLAGTTNSRVKRADGINWARTQGAHVISNSWASATQHQVIDDAIDDALALGRGGLGMVVVFATGNDNSTVSYPANYTTGILAVGAMSPCGERKNPSSCDGENWWGSNFGTQVDVVAPGVLIPTSDRQSTNGYNTSSGTAGNYTQTFNGTSSATPHVAGLAALILSVNNCLTVTQVNNIIERTSRKVGGYSYATTGGRPNGTWMNQMGYGLIDANAAVRMAGTKYLQNLTNNGAATHKGYFVKAGFNVNPWITSGNYLTGAASNVNITASESIEFETGCDLNGTVNAIISSPGSCSTW